MYLLHQAGYSLYATAETYPFLEAKGIPSTLIHYADSSHPNNNIKTMISNKEVDLVVNLWTYDGGEKKNNYVTRRTAVDFGVPLMTNAELFKVFSVALKKHNEGKLQFTKVTHHSIVSCIPLLRSMSDRRIVCSISIRKKLRRTPGQPQRNSIKFPLDGNALFNVCLYKALQAFCMDLNLLDLRYFDMKFIHNVAWMNVYMATALDLNII